MSRRDYSHCSGFTLVEVMIVVVILAILAGAVMPQFFDSTKDAKANNAKYNVQRMRSQIELYKLHHAGLIPANLVDLTQKSSASGAMGTTADCVYGPYLQAVPENGFTGSAKVTMVPTNPPTAASGAVDAGWLYHAATGGVWLDDPTLLTQ
jgi:prepilin-type N-terminal cleavage/methylation domain-containing protein